VVMLSTEDWANVSSELFVFVFDIVFVWVCIF